MRSAGLSDVGLVRKINEDSYLCINLKEHINCKDMKDIYLFIVADGMGGANAGEIASSMAVNEIFSYLNENHQILASSDSSGEDIRKLLKASIVHTNDKIYKKSIFDESCSGMGTTLSMILIIENNIYIDHIGDSRIYLVKNKTITRLTNDHSLVAELVRNGTIKPEEANSHPQKNIITRALGTEYSIDIDECKLTGEMGDYFIICSDGLSNLVEDNEILDILLDSPEINDACNKLVSCAKSRGGYDNITVVITQIDEGGESVDR